LIVLARPDPTPPMEDLFKSVLGLGLTLALEARMGPQHRKPPAPDVLTWRIQMLSGALIDPGRYPKLPGSRFPSLRTAVQDLRPGFDAAVHRALDVGRLEPIPVPQRGAPVSLDLAAIERSIEGLADVFPSADIAVCINLTSCTCFVGQPHNRSTSAATVLEALAALAAPELAMPDEAEVRRIFDVLLDENATETQLDAVIHGRQGRFTFGLVVIALLKSLFLERFGPNPDPEVMARYADPGYRDSRAVPDAEGVAPEPVLFTEFLASIADPTRRVFRGMLFEDHLPPTAELLRSLLRDHRGSGPETARMIDQAVEESIRIGRSWRKPGANSE
jgi:hypothetical protein